MPIFKKEDLLDKTNDRPISISKISKEYYSINTTFFK